jgi:hypothetical protein
MIARAPSFQNGSPRASDGWVCLQVHGLGSIGFPGEGDLRGRPYGKTGFVGVTLVVALRSEHFQEVT